MAQLYHNQTLAAAGIEVDPEDVQSVQRINGAMVVRMKDGSVLVSSSTERALNFGEAIIFEMLAKKIRSNPLFDMSKAIGLNLPKSD